MLTREGTLTGTARHLTCCHVKLSAVRRARRVAALAVGPRVAALENAYQDKEYSLSPRQPMLAHGVSAGLSRGFICGPKL
ncbi:MAG: hypothetical protein AAFQ63_20515 [Cyanobacteria bacterium J06621_11]